MTDACSGHLRVNLGARTRGAVPLILAVLLCCYWLKRHYSTASVDELKWILTPTVRVVEAVTGLRFWFEAGIGYTNTQSLVSVTVACAGVNFLIIAWTTLVLSGSHLSGTRQAIWALAALGLAYIATVLVNSLRIVLAIHLHREHRVEGVVIYLVATCLLYVCGDALSSRGDAAHRAGGEGNRIKERKQPWLSLGTLATPVILYLGVTLVVPALNGAIESGAYWEHATVVLCVVGALLLSVGGLQIGRSLRRHSSRHPQINSENAPTVP